MGEHTSGMWRARKTAINRWAIGAHQGEDYVPIGVASLTLLEFGRGSEEEHAANARLMAAAPDLLAACEEAVSIIGREPGCVAVYDKLQAAIAKAKEQQCTRRGREAALTEEAT